MWCRLTDRAAIAFGDVYGRARGFVCAREGTASEPDEVEGTLGRAGRLAKVDGEPRSPLFPKNRNRISKKNRGPLKNCWWANSCLCLYRVRATRAAVSSMKTSRAGSTRPRSRIQRRRARATSARSCSAAENSLLAHRANYLIQRQVRLLLNQRQQKVRVLLQRRRAPASRLGRTASSRQIRKKPI